MSLTIAVLAAGPGLPDNRLAAVVAAGLAGLGAIGALYTTFLAQVRGRRTRHLSVTESSVDGEEDPGGPEATRHDSQSVLKRMYRLREQDFAYVLRSRRLRNLGAGIAGSFAGAILLTGLVYAGSGAIASGVAISLMATVPGIVSKMYYSRARDADTEVKVIRDDIARIILLEELTPGRIKDELVADLIRGSAGGSSSQMSGQIENPDRRSIEPAWRPHELPAPKDGDLAE